MFVHVKLSVLGKADFENVSGSLWNHLQKNKTGGLRSWDQKIHPVSSSLQKNQKVNQPSNNIVIEISAT